MTNDRHRRRACSGWCRRLSSLPVPSTSTRRRGGDRPPPTAADGGADHGAGTAPPRQRRDHHRGADHRAETTTTLARYRPGRSPVCRSTDELLALRPGHRREARQPPRGPPARRSEPGRHRLRGDRRGADHPVLRHLPLHRRRADRTDPLGPHHRRRPAQPAQPAAVRLVGREPGRGRGDRRRQRREPCPRPAARSVLPRRRAPQAHRDRAHPVRSRAPSDFWATHRTRTRASRPRSSSTAPPASRGDRRRRWPRFDLNMRSVPIIWTWDAAIGLWLRDEYGAPHIDTRRRPSRPTT